MHVKKTFYRDSQYFEKLVTHRNITETIINYESYSVPVLGVAVGSIWP